MKEAIFTQLLVSDKLSYPFPFFPARELHASQLNFMKKDNKNIVFGANKIKGNNCILQ